jgi:hypothetical protein
MTAVIGYRFHDLTLAVHEEEPGIGQDLALALNDLSCTRDDTPPHNPSLTLVLHRQDGRTRVPATAQRMFQAEGFEGFEQDGVCYLTDGASAWQIQLGQRLGEAWLASTLAEKPPRLRRSFWGFGLFKLLRPTGLFSLHAASVISPTGTGVLIVGAPGSGKSTLALGLLRQGWGYLSDDAVLLRWRAGGVEALACRRDAYIDAGDAGRHADLPWGEAVPDGAGAYKRRLCVAATYPERLAWRCLPRRLLLTRLVDAPHSRVRPLGQAQALRLLLAQSGPQLFDRCTMPTHLALLTRLLQQAPPCELQVGRDLYDQPLALQALLAAMPGVA